MNARTNKKQRVATSEVVALGAFLVLLQAADGILTAVGVGLYGYGMEGNVILRNMMFELGHIPALALFKTGAIGIVFLLMLMAEHVSWVKNAIGAVSGVYLFGAIIPWTYLLSSAYA